MAVKRDYGSFGPGSIYIYISHTTAHVIPKRAFSNSQEAEAFFLLARSRKETAG